MEMYPSSYNTLLPQLSITQPDSGNVSISPLPQPWGEPGSRLMFNQWSCYRKQSYPYAWIVSGFRFVARSCLLGMTKTQTEIVNSNEWWPLTDLVITGYVYMQSVLNLVTSLMNQFAIVGTDQRHTLLLNLEDVDIISTSKKDRVLWKAEAILESPFVTGLKLLMSEVKSVP